LQNPIAEWIAENYPLMAAHTARREHRGVRTLEVEDIEQQIWLTIAKKALRANGKGTDFRLWDRTGIANLMTKIAREYVARERIEYMHFAGAFIYTPAIVEVYLKDAAWANLEDVVDIDGRTDVKDALATLPLETQRALFIHYGTDNPYPATSAEYKRVVRAVEAISDKLNMGSGVKIGDLADAA
jgi:DNA-directed RNA polymerase specialized sigma24 family protein